MGSCLSNGRKFDANETLDGFYTRPRATKRRSCSSHQSNSSSGVFSLAASPSRRSYCTTSTTSTTNNNTRVTASCGNIRNATSTLRKQKPSNRSKHTFLSIKEVDCMSIIDDFGEMKMQEDLNQSRGYFTNSISSQSGDDADINISKSNLNIRYTRDTSSKFREDVMTDDDHTEATYERADSPNGCNLEMEMFMMSNSRGIIGKTSSPMPQRRDDQTFDIVAATPVRHSGSYNKWCNFLESTPTYMVHNVTDIPEAVAGHFCPSAFPAFIDVEVDSNDAKRFKFDTEEFDTELDRPVDAAMEFVPPIITTEL